jgi:hypothetical protein
VVVVLVVVELMMVVPLVERSATDAAETGLTPLMTATSAGTDATAESHQSNVRILLHAAAAACYIPVLIRPPHHYFLSLIVTLFFFWSVFLCYSGRPKGRHQEDTVDKSLCLPTVLL